MKTLKLIIGILLVAMTTKSQSWSAVSTGVSNDILSFGPATGSLNIGMMKTPIANGFSVYTGASITNPMPYNINILSTCVYNGEVYIGFDQGTGIAKWNGSSWVNVGTGGPGPSATICAMAVYNGELYVGGKFGTVVSQLSYNFAKWNGSVWSPIENGVHGNMVNSFCVYNGELYIGGDFTDVGFSNLTTNNIAKWNGTSFSAVGSGVTASSAGNYNGVNSMVVNNNLLYIGGALTPNKLYVWNGSSINTVGTFTTGVIRALSSYNNQLYVGGFFTLGTSNNITMWNGSIYSNLGTGCNNPVYALAVWSNTLYVGGNFTTAGSISASKIARWSTPIPPVVVNPTFTITNQICMNGSVSVTANTGTAAITGYTWSSSPVNAVFGSPNSSVTSITFPGSATFTITLTAASGTTTGSYTQTISVLPSPVVSLNSSTMTVCLGNSVTLNASGASTYTWNPNNMGGSSIVVNPTISTTYSCIGTSTAGCTSLTQTISIAVVACPNSINESTIALNYGIYPNPTNGIITITGEYDNISISDITGKILTTNSTDLTNLNSGVYFVTIKKGNDSLTKKIIRN